MTEKTSPSVASNAARVVQMTRLQLIALATSRPEVLRSIAASALTQAPDRDDD